MARVVCLNCNGKKGQRESWGSHGAGWYKCGKCDGKGYLVVPDPPRPPRESKPSREQRPNRQRTPQQDRPQQTSQWLHKPCGRPSCHNQVDYLPSWTHPPNYCKTCKVEMDRLNKPFETHDLNYVMPGMGQTIGQMGCIFGKHIPHQGKIHCSVFDGMRPNDIHTSWDYNAITEEVIGLHSRPNSLK